MLKLNCNKYFLFRSFMKFWTNVFIENGTHIFVDKFSRIQTQAKFACIIILYKTFCLSH